MSIAQVSRYSSGGSRSLCVVCPVNEVWLDSLCLPLYPVALSKTTLKMFLGNLLRLVQRYIHVHVLLRPCTCISLVYVAVVSSYQLIECLKVYTHTCSPPPHRRDPEGIFAEPVTDDIAPGYSALIKHPMDLSTMATKISNHAYWSAEEFKNDFVLMCKNAMTYNSPETIYYSVANSIMRDGLKLIEKVSD